MEKHFADELVDAKIQMAKNLMKSTSLMQNLKDHFRLVVDDLPKIWLLIL